MRIVFIGFLALLLSSCGKTTETPKTPQFIVIDKVEFTDFDTLNTKTKAWDDNEKTINRLPDISFSLAYNYGGTVPEITAYNSQIQLNVSPATIKPFDVLTSKIKIPYKSNLVIRCTFYDNELDNTKEYMCEQVALSFANLPTFNEDKKTFTDVITIRRTSKISYSYEY